MKATMTYSTRFHISKQLYLQLFFHIEDNFIRSDQVSIVDDLAFAVYQDPEIAAIIKNLERKKQECVQGKGKLFNF